MDSSPVNQFTSSTTFVNVFQAKIVFPQGGAGASCVIVHFSARAFAFGTRTMNVRAVLDGSTIALPGEMAFATNDGANGFSRAVQFIFPSVAPGSHSVQIQFRSLSGESVAMGRHSTIVQYAP
jgi:hypothetical protein